MSNIHNERLKETILEDVLSLSINDFQNDLKSMRLKHPCVIDDAINDARDTVMATKEKEYANV